MRRLRSAHALSVLALLGLVLAGVSLAAPRAEARVFVGVGVGVGPYWGPAYPYYYPPPPVVYVPPPPVYIAPPPPPVVIAPIAPQPAPQLWYYCRNPAGYYPTVSACPGGWQTVPATQPQPH